MPSSARPASTNAPPRLLSADRLLVAFQRVQHHAEIVVHVGSVRITLERLAQQGDGLFMLALLGERDAEQPQ
jgi:hypothetical protein